MGLNILVPFSGDETRYVSIHQILTSPFIQIQYPFFKINEMYRDHNRVGLFSIMLESAISMR
jgi:hypothetical protein